MITSNGVRVSITVYKKNIAIIGPKAFIFRNDVKSGSYPLCKENLVLISV
jgi:hypothetical protein